MSVDTGNLETYLTRLISVNENIDRGMARSLQTLSNELAAYGVSIAHRLTGNMANSIHTLGPFPRGDTIESIIESAAPYTIYEPNKIFKDAILGDNLYLSRRRRPRNLGHG